MVAAGVATVLTYPIQTVRIRQQAGLPLCAVRDAFAGLGPKLIHKLVGGFIFFLVKESANSELHYLLDGSFGADTGS